MASAWAPEARDGQQQLSKLSNDAAGADQHIALIEGCGGCSEQELLARLTPYGSIAWCNGVGDGRYLVRFLTKEGASAAMLALEGVSLNGSTMRMAPYSVGHMPGLLQGDSPMARVESIPALLQSQLDYFDMLVAEEAGQAAQQQQMQQQHNRLGQQANMLAGGFPELEPCHPEWTCGTAGTDMLTPVEDEVLSMDDSPLNSFIGGSGLSTSQLWTQRSIGAVARKDLAKIAAMQSLAQQHSNSSSPAPGGLMATGSLGLGSPWGSFTAGSSNGSAAELQMPGMVRRVSSPAGHTTTLTPRSNCSFTAGQDGTAAAMQNLQGLQLQLGSGGPASGNISGWPSHIMQLPSDLGLGDTCGDGTASLLQQQQQLLLMQASLNSEVMSPMLSNSILGGNASGSFGSVNVMGRGPAECSSGDISGMLGGGMPPPPPPPAQQQQGMVAAPPPPPPRGNGDCHNNSYGSTDGRLSGSASPVPAPPPRAMTPSGSSASGQVWGPSPTASPRFAGPAQPQSPSQNFRPPRVATRLFQPGMSNLGHNNWGGQGSYSEQQQQGPGSGTGYNLQQGQQQGPPMLPTGAFNQPPMQQQGGQPPVPPPYGNRGASPVNRGGLPPPPPPGMPPPGYAAASAAAAANGICGSPIPPCSPAGGRFGCPLHGMSSCPASMLESMASGNSSQCMGARSPCPWGPGPLATHNSVGSLLMERSGGSGLMAQQQGAAGGGYGMQQQARVQTPQAAALAVTTPGAPMWKADGSMFVTELLQLLRGGAAAGNSFLCNLRDLLECAVAAAEVDSAAATAETDTASASASSNTDKKAAAAADAAKAAAAPVDAAAFLGMLQEAAAPLMAAAAVAAATAPRISGLGQQPGRRSSQQQRMSEASDAGFNSSAAMLAGVPRSSTGSSMGGLKPIRTAGGGERNSSSAGSEASVADVDTPPGMLLRQQLAGRASGSSCSQPGSPSAAQLQLLYPLHPRTTTNSGREGHMPQPGTPMRLVPQTLPELLSARAALVRLMVSAHGFVQSQQYRGVAARLEGVEAVYDSMHDDPVVVKRRKCREMAAMRETIRQDAAFVQAVSSLSSLRNHIYSLSRKVLIGYGHVEGLPVDLLLGGLTSELATILTDPSGQPPPGMAAAAADREAGCAAPAAGPSTTTSEPGSGITNPAGVAATAAEGAGLAASRSEGGAGGVGEPQGTLPQQVLDFFTCALPLPKLALLVFTEFVPVDPSPCCVSTPVAAGAGGSSSSFGGAAEGAGVGGVTGSGSMAGNASNGGGNAGNGGQRGSNLRHSRRSSNSNAEAAAAAAAAAADGSAQHGNERRGSYNRYSRDGETGNASGNGRDRERDGMDRHGSGGLSRSGRGNGSYSSSSSSAGHNGLGADGCGNASGHGGNGGYGKQRGGQRRSQQCEFDLVAEAAALEAAATAAAPLVAAAVCDLPTGRKTRTSSSDA